MEKINKKKSMLLWMVVIFWMMIIFYFSAQPATQSSELSGGIVEVLVRRVIPYFHTLSLEEQGKISLEWQFIVRKTAHFLVYTILGALTMGATLKTDHIKKGFGQAGIAMTITLLYAISDEGHQVFVPGRSGEIRDVCLDFIGACMGILVIYCIDKKTNWVSSNQNNSEDR
ncbi:MAG: VanZ family protein [Eubacteriaceae bacterium]